MIKLILWLFRKHKWHKDWLGCWICELRFKNNPHRPIENCYCAEDGSYKCEYHIK